MTIGYGYDLKSQLTSITYPGSLTVNYGYDSAGRMTTVKDWLGNTTTYTPNPDSFDTSIAYQNGVKATQTPDNADRLMAITDTHSSTTLASMTYSRDGNNQVTGEADSGVPQVAQPYTYTPLNQVKAAGSSSYGYDAADNLTTLTNGTSELFDPADELCWSASSTGTSCTSPPSGATTYTYNSRGDRTVSTTGSATTTYGYDEASQRTSYTSSSETATYTYNGDGLRMSKTVNGVTTPFTWDAAGSTPLLLSDGTTDYIYGANGTPIEQETARPAITLVGKSSATGTTGTTSLTVNLPSGIQPNDQVYVDTTQSATTTVSAPSTYTLIKSVASGGTAPKAGTSVYRHTVVAGDTSVTFTYSGNPSVEAVVLAVYRGVDPNLPVDDFGGASTAGGTSVVAPSVSPSLPTTSCWSSRVHAVRFPRRPGRLRAAPPRRRRSTPWPTSPPDSRTGTDRRRSDRDKDVNLWRQRQPHHRGGGDPAAAERALLPDRPAGEHPAIDRQRRRGPRHLQLRRQR